MSDTSPSGRIGHSAVWTGRAKLPSASHRMIVFGGCRGDNVACSSVFGASRCEGRAGTNCASPQDANIIFDPSRDSWFAVGDHREEPSPRLGHTAVWTGDEMLVFGGQKGVDNERRATTFNDVFALQFNETHRNGIWQKIAPLGPVPAPRFGHKAFWTGQEMIIWGGCETYGFTRCTKYAPDAASLRRGDDGHWRWEILSPMNAPSPRIDFGAVFSGRWLVVWGGFDASGVKADGAAFDTVMRKWVPLSDLLPSQEGGRRFHSMAWDGLRGRVIVWGGETAAGVLKNNVLILELATTELAGVFNSDAPMDSEAIGRWLGSEGESAPTGRVGHIGQWLSDSLVVWGGFARGAGFLQTGGIFRP